VNRESSTGVAIDRQEGVWRVRLAAPLGTLDWAELEVAGNTLWEALCSSRRPRCVVDLSDLPTLGSAQMALLVQTWKRVGERGGRCVFAAPRDGVREVISIAGLDRIWEIAPTPEAAFELLRPSPRSGAVRWIGWTLALVGTAAALAGRLVTWGGLEVAFAPHWLVFAGAAVGALGGLTVTVWERSHCRYLGLAAAIACSGLAAAEWWLVPKLPLPEHGRSGRPAAVAVALVTVPPSSAPERDARPTPCSGPGDSRS
jgi:anti-anti-sigma factor